MASLFSTKNEKPAQRKSYQRENELRVKKDTRQAVILRTITIEIPDAVRKVKSQSSRDPNFEVTIRLDFWKKNDPFLLHDYRGLTPSETDAAVGVDIAYFHHQMAKVVNKFDQNEWEFDVGYVNKDSLIPIHIQVRKKKQ